MNKESIPFKFKEKHSPLYAAFFTALIYILILLFSGIAGYGNNTILSGDLYSQYTAFIQLFLDTIKHGGNFYYSFSLFLGNPAVSTYAYYCLSPLNLLYLIPFISVSSMTIIIIMLKLSLASAAFCLFQKRVLKQTGLFPVLFAVCYSLCSFTITMQIHIMWLDSLYILPILMILIYGFVKGGSFLPLVAAYAYLFISNFYMGYILGIFSGLCFIVLLIMNTDAVSKTAISHLIKRGLLFILSVILAAGCCAAVLMPAAYELLQQRGSGGSGFSLVDITLLDVFNNMFLGEMQGMGSPIPLIYCGLPVLLLLPLYVTSAGIKTKEKLCALFLLLFYLAGSQFLPIYSFLHAMEAPNWYAHRYAPCIVFILLYIASRSVKELEGFPLKKLIIYSICLLGFYAVMIPLQSLIYSNYATNSHGFFILTACFFTAYILLLYLHQKGCDKKLLSAGLSFILMAELVINGFTCMLRNNFGYEPEETVSAWETPQKSLIPEFKNADTGFYRIRTDNERCFNSPSYFGYAGINSFANVDNVRLRQVLSSLGIGTSFMCIYDQGYTDITDMLLGVKYSIDLNTSEIAGSPLALPVGFMCHPALLNYASTDNVFDNQQALINAMTGETHSFYTPVPDYDIAEKNMEVMSFDDSVLFKHISDTVINGKLDITFPNYKGAQILGYFAPLSEPVINLSAPVIECTKRGYYKNASLADGTIVCAYTNDDGVPELDLLFSSGAYYDYAIKNARFCLYDNSQVADSAKALASHPLVLSSWTDGELSGTVESTEESPILFTSIPYAEGWTAYIDGNPTPIITTVDDAFLSLYIAPGVHDIRLVYNHPYGSASIIISCICICAFLLLILVSKRKKSSAAPEAGSSDKEDGNEEA